jgi:putative addiction module antidote
VIDMTTKLTVRRQGNSLGLTLPKDLVSEMGVKEGDELYVLRTPRGLELTSFDPDFAAIVDDARDFMHRNRNAMKKLAES